MTIVKTMITFYAKLRMIFNREERLMFTIKEFAHANKDLLIIVADPKSDRMFVTYKDKFVNGTIKSPLGKKSSVVKDVLKYSRFNESIDQFITSLVETLHLPTWKGGANQFFQFIDGSMYNIAKSLRKHKTSISPNGRA
ncbi:MAG: hypothetical protein RBG13Loki_0377 [Promethearchaeota archaeon CR_4]|nr:MAG: hypothetical protein RBG13Loki_0377 [Candidatus Lokiarchaeota archaeon CR_4]